MSTFGENLCRACEVEPTDPILEALNSIKLTDIQATALQAVIMAIKTRCDHGEVPRLKGQLSHWQERCFESERKWKELWKQQKAAKEALRRFFGLDDPEDD